MTQTDKPQQPRWTIEHQHDWRVGPLMPTTARDIYPTLLLVCAGCGAIWRRPVPPVEDSR